MRSRRAVCRAPSPIVGGIAKLQWIAPGLPIDPLLRLPPLLLRRQNQRDIASLDAWQELAK